MIWQLWHDYVIFIILDAHCTFFFSSESLKILEYSWIFKFWALVCRSLQSLLRLQKFTDPLTVLHFQGNIHVMFRKDIIWFGNFISNKYLIQLTQFNSLLKIDPLISLIQSSQDPQGLYLKFSPWFSIMGKQVFKPVYHHSLY